MHAGLTGGASGSGAAVAVPAKAIRAMVVRMRSIGISKEWAIGL